MAQELKVDVHGREISIYVRGTCLRMTYRKGDAPWLVCTEFGPDDPEAIFTRNEGARVVDCQRQGPRDGLDRLSRTGPNLPAPPRIATKKGARARPPDKKTAPGGSS
jgi:hypothetical protein